MSLSAALGIAAGEIGVLNAQFALVGHNVANASTPDYAVETLDQSSAAAQGVGMGARAGSVQRQIDLQLQGDLLAQNGRVAALQTEANALQPVDAAQGAVGGGSDIGSLLGKLQDAFSELQTDPSNATQQSAVVAAAGTLAGQINNVADSIGSARQAAQDAVASGVATLNSTLATIGSLSKSIVANQAAGMSTADLQNQRDAAIGQLSQLVGVNVLNQPNGDVVIATQGGLVLPTDGTAFATSDAAIGPETYAPGGGVPPITLSGRDVAAQLSGGSLGASIALRDTVLPTQQANIDEFAYDLASRFSAQGLTLFSDSSGSVPSGGGTPAQAGYVGFANEVQVNPAVAATPSLVRDGTQAVAGSPTGPSGFTPNPAGGPAGFGTMIARVLTYALGSDAQPGVPQPAPATTGLGPSGTLSAGFSPPGDLAALAAAVTGASAQASAAVSTQFTTEQGVQTTLQSQLSAGSAVSVDQQMSLMVQLQQAYTANAHVMSTVQALWSQLLQAVQ